MITRIVRLEISEEHVVDFKEFFDRNKAEILSSPGCRSLLLKNEVGHPNVFFTISEWDKEESLNEYRQSQFFREVWPNVKLWFSAKPLAYSLK